MLEKIDFVVSWVDGSDPEWLKEREAFFPEAMTNGLDINRFRDWNLMRFWFRGVEQYAPWVNKIFFVTNGQVPKWLNTEHPKLRLVKHQDYIPIQYLPTFNSNVIELWLHRIPELSEHFVLFNDDMFLTAPVGPEDFFKNGVPLDMALLDIVTAPDPGDCLPHMQINNFAVINRYFNKKEVLKKNAEKFFSFKYGKELLRNLLLFPFQYFSCFRDSHLPSSYLKCTFDSVWQKERELLEQCGYHRFRSKSDLTHWLMKCWQICEGNFEVRSSSWGHHFELWEDGIEDICRSLEQQRYRTVCLNDSKSDIDFEYMKQRLQESFKKILPERSTFELNEICIERKPVI
ncbi:MAG: Stealth CR1 domain-containing protein [Lachnospiraceae bacterium]|nr:Stealth CR1 domain-containing protein [Lachnospiraceae bacterium]MDY4970517.1 Stealth CR1 domain-containing protein [Lachnospiraceae bacterium]